MAVTGDEALTVAVKPKLFRRPGPPHARSACMRVEGRADSDRRGLVVYLLTGEAQMALRVPTRVAGRRDAGRSWPPRARLSAR